MTLSWQQDKVLRAARSIRPIEHKDGSVTHPRLLVSGHQYRTALSLERMGLGTVSYQGPSQGWFAPIR